MIAFPERFKRRKVLIELKCFEDFRIGKAAVFILDHCLHPVFAQDAHHKQGGVKMQRPLVFATDGHWCDAGRLALLTASIKSSQ
jgi:hypothetical protein